MTFTLLFDLDDTLLDTNLDAFLSGYFKKFASFMAGRVPPEKFMRAMFRSTQIMYGSKRPDQTLEQVFSENFYPELGFEQADLAADINRFYDDVFPTLVSLTTQRPEAISFVEWAFSKGWNVAIATDPLFPRKAIYYRLGWAGLAPEKYPFTLISDFHNFHFAKESLAFYPEFLAKMRWVDAPLLMVGDSYERDVIPSQKTGLPVFWLNSKEQATREVDIPQGGFAQLKNYLETIDLTTLKVNYKAPQSLIAFLQATPAALHTIQLNCTKKNEQKQTGEWSLLEIICHLRDVEREVNFPRVEAILREENAFIPGQSTDHWAEERQYARQDFDQAWRDFVSARLKLIDTLSGLSQPDWDRKANHTYLGPTALRELVEFMVDHDRLHIEQSYGAA